MNTIWGAVLIVFTGILCWLAQTTVVFAPKLAERLGLIEPEADVDPTFFVDARAEAVWDMISIWTLPVAGVLLLLNSPWWVYFGLVGGGVYLYFVGRGAVVRLAMQRRGIRIGKPETLKLYYVFLALWGLIAIITIVMAIVALPLP